MKVAAKILYACIVNTLVLANAAAEAETEKFRCKEGTAYNDPLDCAFYFRCSVGVLHRFPCPPPLQFSEILQTCANPMLANCSTLVELVGKIGQPKPEDLDPTLLDCEEGTSAPDMNSCVHFQTCTGGKFIRFVCPPMLAFNPRTLTCDLEKNVKCEDNPILEHESGEEISSDRWDSSSELRERQPEYIKRRNVVIRVHKKSIVIKINL